MRKSTSPAINRIPVIEYRSSRLVYSLMAHPHGCPLSRQRARSRLIITDYSLRNQPPYSGRETQNFLRLDHRGGFLVLNPRCLCKVE
ncbi:hypothetical protein COMA2_60064 [Candidatus Nitrospira nitrificans]|uniref:Uncharacterized protein n=1 Tax=Candidatus Nitrospira nitrificans TaxID=1742973 RepID=A0A0S4LQR3_9BACT|nr:hypothetical protein COMA2_60064 [Candidatus Nitrospira nitrificans]